MSASILMSYEGKAEPCSICRQPIVDGPVVALISTQLWTAGKGWNQPREENPYGVTEGDACVDLDWLENALAHLECIQKVAPGALV